MLRTRIQKDIEKLVSRGTSFSVSRPERVEFGDYSSNVALIAAKKLDKNPRDLAAEMKSKLEKAKLFSKINIAGRGFLNFWIRDQKIAEYFYRLSRAGSCPRLSVEQGKKIQVEFISANPTGPLTLANGRGGFLGDALSNVLELAGYTVEREYYVNDTGNQIMTLGKSLAAATGFIPEQESFYRGNYIKKWARKNKKIVKKLRGDPLKLGQRAAKDFLSDIKRGTKKAGINFDRWTSEDALHKKSFVDKALTLFKKKKVVYEKDGAVWLETSKFDDDKDRVVVTSDGYPTYFLADAGHYLETKKRGFLKKVNILGPDHHGYVARIQAAAEIIGLQDSEIIVTQAVRLMRGDKEVRMSKRRGEFIAFEELLDMASLDAIRYFFLMHAPESHMDFDLALAKKRSQENPVYYVQYAHARMASILRKARRRQIKFSFDLKPGEITFLKNLLEIYEALEDTARDYQIHRLPKYAYELAQAFSHFYRDIKVIGSGPDEPRRLFIVKAAKKILGSLLGLMGISAPERM